MKLKSIYESMIRRELVTESAASEFAKWLIMQLPRRKGCDYIIDYSEQTKRLYECTITLKFDETINELQFEDSDLTIIVKYNPEYKKMRYYVEGYYGDDGWSERMTIDQAIVSLNKRLEDWISETINDPYYNTAPAKAYPCYEYAWYKPNPNQDTKYNMNGTTLMVIADNVLDADKLVQYYYPFKDEFKMVMQTVLVIDPDIKGKPEEVFDSFNRGELGWLYDDQERKYGHDVQFLIVPGGDPRYGGRAHMIHSHPANKLFKTFTGADDVASYDIIILYKTGQDITPPDDRLVG